MVLLPKVRVGEAGAVTGSWLNVMRSLPGSAATDGLTGAVKRKTRCEGSSGATEAVKWVATLPMKRRPDSWCRVAGPPRKRGRRKPRAAKGRARVHFP